MKSLFLRFRLGTFVFLCCTSAVQSMELEILSKNDKTSYGTISIEDQEEVFYESNRCKVFCMEYKDEWGDRKKNCSDRYCDLSCIKEICLVCCVVCVESDCECVIQ